MHVNARGYGDHDWQSMILRIYNIDRVLFLCLLNKSSYLGLSKRLSTGTSTLILVSMCACQVDIRLQINDTYDR